MKMSMPVLQCGNCEPLKAGFHATTLGLSAVMGLYNAAAWLARRQRHLAVNATIYAALAIWEQRHVAHHLAELRRCHEAIPTLAPVVQPVPVVEAVPVGEAVPVDTAAPVGELAA